MQQIFSAGLIAQFTNPRIGKLKSSYYLTHVHGKVRVGQAEHIPMYLSSGRFYNILWQAIPFIPLELIPVQLKYEYSSRILYGEDGDGNGLRDSYTVASSAYPESVEFKLL